MDGITYLSKKDDLKMFENNSLTVTLNILYMKEKEIGPDYISKINSNCEKQVILLVIPNVEKEGWHYLAVKELSALLHGITLKYKSDVYCFNCLHPFRTEKKN